MVGVFEYDSKRNGVFERGVFCGSDCESSDLNELFVGVY